MLEGRGWTLSCPEKGDSQDGASGLEGQASLWRPLPGDNTLAA